MLEKGPASIPVGSTYALVDENDLPLLMRYRWHLKTNDEWRYAATSYGPSSRRRRIFMHRLLLKAKRGEHVDHVNGNGLDNRRENLRRCTLAQNQWNRRKTTLPTSSQFKGVHWRSAKRRWRAAIRINGIQRDIGTFTSEISAARAYDEAARAAFGEFAHTNF